MIEYSPDTRRGVDPRSSLEDCGNLGEFPIRDALQPGESGHGYVLRMAYANCLGGLPAVKKMLGKTRFSVLQDIDANQIARWFGADPEALRLALGATGIGKPENDFEFCGYPIERSYFVNRMYPRACPMCLEQTPYCKSEWELSLVTACHLHSVALIDCCPWCGEKLSWNRPMVTMCKCGGMLTETSKLRSATALEVAASGWIVWSLNPMDESSQGKASQRTMGKSFECELLRLLKPLSLGGGMQLIYALATAERSAVAPTYVSHRQRSSTASAREMLQQADAMVEKLMAFQKVDFRKSNIAVIVNLLAEAAKANASDRSLAYSLIHTLLRQGGRSNWKSRHPQLSQYELF